MFSGGKTSTPSNDGTSTVPSNVYLLVSSPAPHEDVLCKSVLYLTSNNHHLLAPFHYISERCILLLCNICVRTNVCRRIHCQITSSEFTTFTLYRNIVSSHTIFLPSQMLGDSSAMVIDSLTYLFNSYAERVKNISLQENDDGTLSESEKELRRLKRTRQRLWLEILPPLCSVMTLIGLTIYIIMDAWVTLEEQQQYEFGEDDESSSAVEPNIGIMFVFSALNLGLDILNVTCFARAKHAFGFAVIDQDRHRYMLAYDGSLHNVYADSMRLRSEVDLSGLEDDVEGLVNSSKHEVHNYSSISDNTNVESTPLQINKEESKGFHEVNLNMCSAYTHVFADTLRSTAVLLAAGISYTFKVGAPAFVDAIAALAVSVIILLSLGPLLRGIGHAWVQLRRLSNFEARLAADRASSNGREIKEWN
jgi:Co/Zn/Cd efflux system component